MSAALAVVPMRHKSRILTEFVAAREQERRAERERAERRAAMMPPARRSFTAAAASRLTAGWGAANTGINVDLEGSLARLRGASRDLCQNTDIGKRFEGLVKRNIVGAAGLTLQVRAKTTDTGNTLDVAANSAIERHFRLWSERGSCDVTGRLSLRELFKLIAGCLARDGEFLIRRVRNRAYAYGYKLQVLDVDRLDLALNVSRSETRNAIRMGVEIDAAGAPLAYWLTAYHPGDPGSAPSQRRERVPADEIFHDFITVRPEQVRGFPWAHAVMNRINMLNGYEEAAVTAARVGASKMGFYTVDKESAGVTSDDMADAKDAAGNLVQDVEPGMLQVLPPGVGFTPFDPDYPHANFESFVTACMRGIASGLDVSAHNLTGNMRDVNYSSARIAELSERDVWRDLQQFFIESAALPIYREWLQMALLSRAITMDSGKALPAERLAKFAQASSFQPRGWQWVDPRAEAEAAVTQIENRLKSRRQVVEEQGGDLEQIVADEVAERAMFDTAGLPPIATGNTQPAQNQPNPAGNGQE